MLPLPRINERDLDLLVSYGIGDEETICEAIVQAFLAANVDVVARDSSIHEWIDTDALEGFDWRSDHELYVSTPIWNHQVVVTAEAVRVYSDSPDA